MASTARIIIGLGNPGAEYADTKHNVGFRVAEAVAERSDTTFDKHIASATVGEGRWKSRPLVVAKPLTFMNRSGESVRALLRRYRVVPNDLLVVVDDINLPVGSLRLRRGGGSGGHNGLEDIADSIQTGEFPRLRIGVGSDFGAGGQSDYVLSPFDPRDEDVVSEVVRQAAEAALCFVSDGLQTAMNRFNRSGRGPKPDAESD